METTTLNPLEVGKETHDVILYTYYRSSCSWRVRIALAYKQIVYQSKYIHLLKSEQHASEYARLNSSQLLPTLIIDGHVLNQSIAILEYLEESRPLFPLLPSTPKDRAIVRTMVQIIASDIQPVQNLRVLEHFSSNFENLELKASKKLRWAQHWIQLGLISLESQVSLHSTSLKYCFGDTLSMVDCCFVPQMYNALRFQVDCSSFPKLMSIYQHLITLEVFQKASPENQQDFPKI
ncbi:hypothetical protein HMI54_013023 [Coelomomyces lativittatus]|nr:hypothetical protein HMI56_000358 [Coelomomyces lativittatus]KAJ1514534.1 hypothetical protein HMI55_004579 [Coelomomyces lativittatus]KAJ1515018.1 hypothetical protein HMI54_013023 [Coelomomyces lativittatus]